MNLIEMKGNHHAAVSKAEGILAAAEAAGRQLTSEEAADFDAAYAEAQALAPRIATSERQNTLSKLFRGGHLVPGAPSESSATPNRGKRTLSADYANAFANFVASGGQNLSAALYEGSNPSGGYAVPVTVAGDIVPLAPAETGIRSWALVVPTTNDLRLPRKTATGTAAAKAETGTTVNAFTESGPTLDSFTLSAFMAGVVEKISFELAQDVPAFQAFAIADMLNAQQQFEEAWYASGSGTGQPQGVLGNVGTGVAAAAPDASGNLVSIDATLDLIGTLNAAYHDNASFLMARPTSILIRKAQRQANLFEPVWTREGGVDRLHGYPVIYSSAMPAAAPGSTPIIFGDGKQAYVVGDRGGNGINVKILDQPFAVQGQIALLAYRRTDGRVRRSEAAQALTLHS